MRLSYLPGIPAPPMEKKAAIAPEEEYAKFLAHPTDLPSPTKTRAVDAMPSWMGAILGAAPGGVASYDILKTLGERVPPPSRLHPYALRGRYGKLLTRLFGAGKPSGISGPKFGIAETIKRIPRPLGETLSQVGAISRRPKLAAVLKKLPGVGHWAVAAPIIAGALLGRWATKD